MFKKLLIANRGVISRRIARTLRRLGVRSVAVYSEADAASLHVAEADEAVLLGPGVATESYLAIEKVIAAAKAAGVEAIHPGYGFLSENADFAEAVEAAGLAFVGPTPAQLRQLGLKHTARSIAEQQGVPLCAGTGLLNDADEAAAAAARIGYPVILKSTAGSGGIGMRVCRERPELIDAFASVDRLSRANFRAPGVFLEKFVPRARHVEVQIFGDGEGRVIALGERDCSAQRRHQKVIEETPAPGLSPGQRAGLVAAAIKLGQAVGYRSAGTVEFIVDIDTGAFFFLEVNARLQVEHGVTEEVTGVDLVEWMVRLAAGDRSFLAHPSSEPRGHAIEVRLYAEDPHKNFQPSAGLITDVTFHPGARGETWVQPGVEVPPFYDPLLAKVIVHGNDRAEAVARLKAALDVTAIGGIESNLDYLRQVVGAAEFLEGRMTTQSLGAFVYAPRTIDVLDAGPHTTVQDYPGRTGFREAGVPPAGPIDSLAFRFANRLVNNPEFAAGLEIAMAGPTLRFNTATEIALTGADLQAELNGIRVPRWKAIEVGDGDVLRMRGVEGPGARAYLAVRGGVTVPRFLGSRSTYSPGSFGGHAGRALRLGDVLHLGESDAPSGLGQCVPTSIIPPHTHDWELGVLYGPHGAPDFFAEGEVDSFFDAEWKVHFHSDRSRIRLIGPHPTTVFRPLGELSQPSPEMAECPLAVGAISFAGDFPFILGPDGPSLGREVFSAVVVEAELWKLGQMRPGDSVRFRRMPLAEANAREAAQDSEIKALHPMPDVKKRVFNREFDDAVQYRLPQQAGRAAVCYRRAGDKSLLVEYPPAGVDLVRRFRVHALMQRLEASHLPGIVDLTPGAGSLLVSYDSRRLHLADLMEALLHAESEMPDLDEIEVPSRVVYLPFSWSDPDSELADASRSVGAVGPDPDFREDICRLNGLASRDEVESIVLGSSYLVTGFGGVGAPWAVPLDPRHRLVAFGPDRAAVRLPEDAVTLGHGCLRIAGPGDRSADLLVGRTLPVWNTFVGSRASTSGRPWLLRLFDQLRFHPVSAEELQRLRSEYRRGKRSLRIETTSLRLRDHRLFLAENGAAIDGFRRRQEQAIGEERLRRASSGASGSVVAQEVVRTAADVPVPDGARVVHSHLPGSVWQVVAKEGERVARGDKLLILESMKIETAVTAAAAGVVSRLLVTRGAAVSAGQALAVITDD